MQALDEECRIGRVDIPVINDHAHVADVEGNISHRLAEEYDLLALLLRDSQLVEDVWVPAGQLGDYYLGERDRGNDVPHDPARAEDSFGVPAADPELSRDWLDRN